MKPPPFDYYKPSSLDEALSLLKEYGDEAKILAGGQSLMPLLNMRLAKPAVIVDINGIPGLDYIQKKNGYLAIGALTRHRSVERSQELDSLCPLLPAVAGHLGSPQIRNRGTFGGSMAHADPAAEFCAVVYSLGGQVVAQGPDGSRTIPIDSYFVTVLTTCLEPTEIVTEVLVPVTRGPGWAFEVFAPRHGDFPIAGVVISLEASGGKCTDARIGMFGLGPTPLRARQAEGILLGQKPDEKLFDAAGDVASREAEPVSDVRASEDYRRSLTRWLVSKNLRTAMAKLAK